MKRTLVVLSAVVLCAFLALPAFAKEITLRGKLQKTVEPGAWLIVVGKKEYLILNARKFQKEKWFAEGTEVEATGEIKSDVVTTSMQGTPFEARLMRPFEPGESAEDGIVSRRLDSRNSSGRVDSTTTLTGRSMSTLLMTVPSQKPVR